MGIVTTKQHQGENNTDEIKKGRICEDVETLTTGWMVKYGVEQKIRKEIKIHVI